MNTQNIVIAKGRTIDEAVSIGLSLLDAVKQEVNIEILEHGKVSFLGLFSKPAKVKLTKVIKDSNPNNDNSNSNKDNGQDDELQDEALVEMIDAIFEKELDQKEIQPLNDGIKTNTFTKNLEKYQKYSKTDGKIWIENGMLFHNISSSQQKLPTISPSRFVEIQKNGHVITTTTTVSEYDEIVLKPIIVTKDTTWKIEITKSKMKACLHVQPGYRKKYSIIDQEPNEHLVIKTEETIQYVNELDEKLIFEQLESLGVIEGIDHKAIQDACHTTKEHAFLIANGKEPIHGKHGSFDRKIEIPIETEQPLLMDNGTVNYKELKKIPKIEKGEIIGIIHPPEKGEDGFTITGEKIKAMDGLPIHLRLGQGTQLLEDQKTVVAVQSGRPYIETRGQIVKVNVMPKLDIYSNVNIKTGNIHFLGDIEVFGNIEEDMVVTADGDIMVHGTVSYSKITARTSLKTKGNIIKSKLTVGKSNLLIAELGKLIGELQEQLQLLIRVLCQLYGIPSFQQTSFNSSNSASLINIILERKLPTFEAKVAQFHKTINKKAGLLSEDWVNAARNLNDFFIIKRCHSNNNLDELVNFESILDKLHIESITPPDPDAVIHIPYCVNSEIYCSGDINILGQGVFTSELYSGGSIQIDGIVKGGHLFAKQGLKIHEVESNGAQATHIVAGANGFIEIGKVMEGTVIQIGNRKHTLLDNKENLIAKLIDGVLVY